MGIFDNLFSSKQYGIESITLDGQKVKSRAEKFIADYFVQHGIRYQYEKPAESHFWIFTNKISKPDFYLPEYNVYVEYWGLLDADKKRVSRDYERAMKWKMAMYHKHKIKFISIYPKNLDNFDWIFKKKLRDVCGAIIPSSTSIVKQGVIAPPDTIRQRIQKVRNYCSLCGGKVKPIDTFCSNCGKKLV